MKFDKIRDEFFKNYKENIGMGKYHKYDLDKLRRNNEWLKAFYKYSQEDHEKTITMMNEVLTWRSEFGCNELIVSGKPPVIQDAFKKGGLFWKNEDKNGTKMLHFVVKTHKKENFSPKTVQRYISYFFESAYKFNLDDPIVLVFDMSDTGYANLDMDMIKFVVTCLKTYYPGLIDYMIVYQMPFIFNAAWKIIKNWLPPSSVNLIKFCDKKSVKEFVQDNQLFVHMGGTDKYHFVYDPEMFILKEGNSLEEKLLNNPEDFLVSDKLESYELIPNEQSEPMIIETHGEPLPIIEENIATNDSQQLYLKTDAVISNKPENKSSSSFTDPVYSDDHTKDNILKANLLSISPGNELLFNVTDGRQDITKFINLINTSDQYLAYKIKITSPDKFRVKPGSGIIPTSSSAEIMINLLKEFHNLTTNHRDKFLILWTPIDQPLQNIDLAEFWKKAVAKKQNINEHKVKCLIKNSNPLSKNSSTSFDDKSLVMSPSTTSVRDIYTDFNNRATDLTKIKRKNSNSQLQKTEKENRLSKNSSLVVFETSSLNSDAFESIKTESKLKKVEITPIQNNYDDVMGHENKIIALNQQHHQNTKPSSNQQHSQNVSKSSDQLSTDETNRTLLKLQNKVDSVIENQNRLNKQYIDLLWLIYFLILLNIFQLIFQSDYIDSILFD